MSIETIPVKRFYKVLSITNSITACIGIAACLITYYLGISQGNTDCKLDGSVAIIEQQGVDNEIITKEYDSFISNSTDDYLLRY